MDNVPVLPDEVKKIAVLRANALGDLIFAIPAIKGLKEFFPNAEIVYLGKKWHCDFLKGRTDFVDRIVEIPKYKGVPDESDVIEDAEAVDNFFSAMKQEQFDLAFQMHGGGQNLNPFVKKLGAKLTIGFKTPSATALDIYIPYIVYHNEILRYIELVSTVGVKVDKIEPVLKPVQSDFDELTKVILPEEPYVVIHPGASEIRRTWDVRRFGQITEMLTEKGFTVYLTGSEKEIILCNELQGSSNNNGISLAGKLNLKALTALLSKAQIVVSNDTGPLHLSRALGTCTVGIYLGVNMIMASPVTVKKHRTCISWTYNCPKCGFNLKSEDFNKPKGNCTHDFSFLNDVSVEEVWMQIEELLAFQKEHGMVLKW